MLNNTRLSRANYDNTLIGWAAQIVKTNVFLGATTLTYCNGLPARNTLTGTYNWTITGDASDCSALPLHLLSFTALPSGADAVALEWSTGFELNVASIAVQRSNNSATWNKIYSCTPKGSNSNYEAFDYNPLQGNNYYRLFITDRDGSQKVSEVKLVKFNNTLRITAFPNPTNGTVTISNVRQGDLIILVDANGRQVFKKQAVNQVEKLDMRLMSKGIYFMAVTRKSKVISNEKIIRIE
jgi:hypothetical protein